MLRALVRHQHEHERFDSSSVKNILVVRQHDQLGDMLCTVPLLRALRQHFPAATLTLVTSPVSYSIMLYHPCVDDVVNYDKSRLLSSLRVLARAFRGKKFDLAIVPATVSISFTSNVIALLSGAKWRIGPKSLNGVSNASAYCFTTAVDLDWNNDARKHQTWRNLDLVRPFTIETDDVTCTIGLTDDERKTATTLLAPLHKRFRYLIGIHPGAGKIANRWDAEHFASVANRISKEYHAGIVVTSGPMDREPVERMLARLECEYLLVDHRPIREVAAILDGLDLYLTNDTGTMHISGATATNVLAIFGPTDPLQWAPIGQKNHYISAKDGDIASIIEDEVFDMAGLILQGLHRR